MNGDILVINCGSSSVKFSVFSTGAQLKRVARGMVDGIGESGRLRIHDAEGLLMAEQVVGDTNSTRHDQALEAALEAVHTTGATSGLGAVGHRVVHGGAAYSKPVRVDTRVLHALQALIPLAPLHQQHNLAGIHALAATHPQLPQVACFDTAFHSTQPPEARHFALPRDLTNSGIRRYGFHGLSYEYIVSRLPKVAPAEADGKIVVAHLGNGASMCALLAGRSVDTTMGLTALDGLPMGTRCGALDPGVVLYLLSERGMNTEQVTDMLYRQSGLLGVSTISHDMRVLLADGRDSAREAIAMFVYRISRELGAMTAALGGLDALVFTGGIGENAAPIRAAVCERAYWLGVRLDARLNAAGETRISHPESNVPVYVIPTDEGAMIARHTWDLLPRDPRESMHRRTPD